MVRFAAEREAAGVDEVFAALDNDLVGLVPVKRKVQEIAALLLADVLEQRGRYDEASRLCPVIRETSDPNDLVNFIGVDALEGYLLARDGDVESGERLVRRAVERADETDFYNQKGRAFELLAQTLVLAAKRPEALQAACSS